MFKTYADTRVEIESAIRFYRTHGSSSERAETIRIALSCYEHALDWAHDTGVCHFCDYEGGKLLDHPSVPHSDSCPLFGLK